MGQLMMINPVEIVSQSVTLVVIIFIVALMIKHWDRVLVALTGDDRIHGTSLDCVWWTFFKCCGTCTGDWSRWLTKWSCCPKRIRGMNVLQYIGRLLGITSYTVELKNIVVGDLPWVARGTFYICVECSANPPMVTSMAEEKLPKIIHYPEVITLRLRWSPLEEKVRISVKVLHLFGSKEVCCVHIPAMSIIEWSGNGSEESMRRFEMKPSDLHLEGETPPWILVELSQPSDERDLDHFRGQTSTVRTANRDGHCDDLNIEEFKHRYTLLDSTGHAIQEPLEQDLSSIDRRAQCVSSTQHCLGFLGLLCLVGFIAVRVYAGSCYRRIRWITIAYMHNRTNFPISRYELRTLVTECHVAVDGTGIPAGGPCNPSFEEVMGLCRSREEGGHYPSEQPSEYFLGRQLAGLGLPRDLLPCPSKICEINHQLKPYDAYAPLAAVVFLLSICSCRIVGNAMVRAKKYDLQVQRANETRYYQEQMATGSGGFAGRGARQAGTG